jgi:tetratricopeptide (TPR) repeat protein
VTRLPLEANPLNEPARRPAELAHAHALLNQRKFTEAETVCREVLAQSPRDAAATHMLGLVRATAGDLVGAESLLRASIELDPQRVEFPANLANVLRRLGRLPEAERALRAALEVDPAYRPARLALTRTLSALGQHATAEAECRDLIAKHGADAQALTTLAMILRDQNRLPEAEALYRRALDQDASNAIAHHNLGALYAQLDRAEQALDELQRAASLGTSGFELDFNMGRALLGLYRIEEAEHAFARAVALDPLHGEAQLNLARLRYMTGDPKFARDLAAAAAAHRDRPDPQLLLAGVLRRAGDLNGAENVLRDLLARFGPLPELKSALSLVLLDANRLKEAEDLALDAVTERPQDTQAVETLVVILLARGRPDDAMPFISSQRGRQPLEQSWIAYEATAARLLDQPSYRELYDYNRLVQIFDLEPPPGWSSMAELNAALASALNARHRFPTHPLDQSMKNGSQTARSLLTESDPAIQAILRAFAGPIDSFRRAIGNDPGHPLSARNFGRASFSGAWSVQLRREGFHVNHIHPQGWISSAYYVTVPSEVANLSLMSGWIKFGEPRYPAGGLHAEHYVQPRPGRLVLFPSYMWHGTNPIHGVEPRTTIAFDAVPQAPV